MQNFADISRACELRPAHAAPMSGRVASITDAGPVVEVPDPFAVPEVVVLAIRCTEHECRVMRRANWQMAVMFENAA